jgi:rhodanese-related sulfurtransferase
LIERIRRYHLPLAMRFLFKGQKMPKIIDRHELRRLIEKESMQVVEVLPREEYESEHIAGAISLPLDELDAASAKRLDAKRPVVVYCNDFT